MNRPSLIVLLSLAAAAVAWPCVCAEASPACAYLRADVIFLGRVSFTNHEGSSGVQATLVRFDLEETFKGIPAETKRVWVDPGSFSSCYEVYNPGERYLIFAYRVFENPADALAMMLKPPGGKSKPLPPGIDPAHPPNIYWAPECSGSRPADRFPHIELDYAMLRAYRAGEPSPRIFGRVYLAPYRGWPELSGPQLKGAQVTLTGNGTTLRTTTATDGTFALAEALPGDYSVTAELPPYTPAQPHTTLTVPKIGCAYEDITLRTTSKLEGVVLDHQGHPAARIPVGVSVLTATQGNYPVGLGEQTDAEGKFVITGVPEADLHLSYGGGDSPSTEIPYPLVYYPDSPSPSQAVTLRLRLGEQRTGIVLRLPPPYNIGHIALRAVRANGHPVSGLDIHARLDGRYAESATTNAKGAAAVPCVEGFQYQLEASALAGRARRSGVIRSRPVTIVCGKDSGPLTLTLERERRF